MRHLHGRPLLALTLAALCVLSASGCASAAAPSDAHDTSSVTPADSNGSEEPREPKEPKASEDPHTPGDPTDNRIVLTEPTGQPQMDALLSGRFGFIGDTCLGLVMEDGGAFLVRMPEGTRVEKVGDSWRVFTPGAAAEGIAVGDRVKGGGGHLYAADADDLADVPAACQGVGLAQFRIEK